LEDKVDEEFKANAWSYEVKQIHESQCFIFKHHLGPYSRMTLQFNVDLNSWI